MTLSYWYSVHEWLTTFLNDCVTRDGKKKYEFINSLTAWILNAMTETNCDRIDQALRKSVIATTQFKKEITEKDLGDPDKYIKNLFIRQLRKDIKVNYKIHNDEININDRLRIKRTERINYYLSYYKSENVVSCLVRYACLQLQTGNTSSYQWAYPYANSAINAYEAFASPFNVDIKNPRPMRKYCSPFSEDKIFGSLGSFFNLHKDKLNEPDIWYINPFFTEYGLVRAAEFALKNIPHFVFVMPDWRNPPTEAYKLLDESKCTKKFLQKNTYKYYDVSKHAIPAKFGSVIFQR